MANDRLDLLPDYPFQRLRDLIDGHAPPAGLAPIVMSIGEPRHAPPPVVARTLADNAALWGRYPPVDGSPDFRRAVADWLTRRFRLPEGMVAPDRHVLPVAGTREALYMVSQLLVPSQKAGRPPVVAMPNPFYQVYAGGAVMAGAEPLYLPATRATGFLPDLGAVPPETWARTAALFLCSPANPQGAVADRAYLAKAIELARTFDFVLVMDECYAEIYRDEPPPGALEACAAAGDGFANVLVFHSLSKRSSVPGLRSGFVAGDPDLIALFARLRSYGGAGVPEPTLAASAALWRDEAHAAENRALYRAKFDVAERLLGGRLGFYRPAGGFFLWLEVGDGEAAALRLWREAALRVLPGAYLAMGEGAANPGRAFIRVALVHDAATVEEGLGRLARVLG
jgi:succinyldiaminopimelate transaminase